MADRPLFRDAAFGNLVRSVLRSDFGYTAEQVDGMSLVQAADALNHAKLEQVELARYRAMLRRLVDDGSLSEAQAERITMQEARVLAHAQYDFELENLERESQADARYGSHSHQVQITKASGPSDTQIVATLADLVTIIAAQQAQIAELREQVVSLHHSNMASFGRQAIIEQLSKEDYDLKDFEVKIEFEESSEHQDERQLADETSSHTTTGEARDTRAAIEGLASRVAALNGSRTVNLEEMNQKVVRLIRSAKRQAKVSTKGALHIKIGELRRPRDPGQGSGTLRRGLKCRAPQPSSTSRLSMPGDSCAR
jgi:hypothetical protein